MTSNDNNSNDLWLAATDS